MPDILQRTLGKPGVSHNHRSAFCGVFLSGTFAQIGSATGDFYAQTTSRTSCQKCEDAEISQCMKGNLGIFDSSDSASACVQGRRFPARTTRLVRRDRVVVSE